MLRKGRKDRRRNIDGRNCDRTRILRRYRWFR
jgi:hypothetical protein